MFGKREKGKGKPVRGTATHKKTVPYSSEKPYIDRGGDVEFSIPIIFLMTFSANSRLVNIYGIFMETSKIHCFTKIGSKMIFDLEKSLRNELSNCCTT